MVPLQRGPTPRGVWGWWLVHLVDDHGRVMDAEYHVEADGGYLAVIQESRSGSSRSRSPRNRDYIPVQTILLDRLGKLNAVLAEAVVDSGRTQRLGMPEASRRLIDAPIQLALEPAPDALRRRMGTRQSKIAQAPGATKGGNATKRIRFRISVPGFQLIDADRLAEALSAPITESGQDDEDRRADEALERALATDAAVVDAEASNTDSTQYQREAATVTVERKESQFVARYRQTLPTAEAKRLRLAVGLTDLYLVDTADLIEAKRSPAHRYVREALGQLLDYAAHCTQPLNRLTALFPGKPTASDIRLLHAYGIDCVYWEGGDRFARLEAPAEARDRMRAAWAQNS